MPELRDVELYLHALRPRIVGHRLGRVRIAGPFLLRTVEPAVAEAEGQRVEDVRRLGKRIVWHLDNDIFVVIHLMIAGRFRWKAPGTGIPGKVGLAAFDFDDGTLILTEAGTTRRASLALVRGAAELAALDPGGIEILTATPDAFAAALTRENHTLKRALTDPHLLAGIGNAYSDEILRAARLSPMQLTSRLDAEAIGRLHRATVEVLTRWRGAVVSRPCALARPFSTLMSPPPAGRSPSEY